MKTRLQFPLVFFLSTMLVLTSCKDDPPPPPEPPSTKAVLIANSGLSTSGTGTLSAYDPMQKTVEHNVFYKANTYPLGNTLFSIFVDGDRTYLVVNGEREILMVNSETYELIKEPIEGFEAPRYMHKVNENKFYISDWQEEAVWIMNGNGHLKGSIPTGVAPEKMVSWENMVFVANSGSVFTDSTVTVINSDVDTVMTTLAVAHNPNSLQIDKDGILWVLCSGIEDQANPLSSTPGVLMSFDLTKDSLFHKIQDSLIVRDSLVFSYNQDKPTCLTINADGNTLFFLDNDEEADLWRFDIESGVLPNSYFIDGNFNGLGYDPIERELYLSDPLDGDVDGDIYRYDETGEQLDLFRAGLIPGNFGFK